VVQDEPANIGVGAAAVIAGLLAAALTVCGFVHGLGFGAFMVASIVGAAVVGLIFPVRSRAVAVVYVIPETIVLIGLPLLMAAMSDGHPPNVRLLETLPLVHIALSLGTLAWVRRMSSQIHRLIFTGFVVACGIAAWFVETNAAMNHEQALLNNIQGSAPMAFERDLLPYLLSAPEKVAWNKPSISGPDYSISGNLPMHRGKVLLTSHDPYDVTYSVTVATEGFDMGPQNQLKDRLARARIWLKKAGISSELLPYLDVYSRQRWDTDMGSPGPMVSIELGNDSLTLTGRAPYSPAQRAFIR
jgi:hypothetical protein